MKQFVAITMFVVFLLLMLAGCADRAIVPEVTSTPTTEPNAGVTATPLIEDTATPNPNETQEVTPDLTPETTTVTTVAPTATPKPTPTKTASPTKTPTPTKTPATTPGLTPRPMNPAKLTDEQEKVIKEDYLALCKVRYGYDDSYVLTTDDITDFIYLGTYNAGVAVIVMCKIDSFPQLESNVDIEGFHFSFAHYGWSPQIYNNGDFTYLHDAYKAGVLSVEDIRDIHWYYTHQ